MIKIGLLGLGTVGLGVCEILLEKKSIIEEQTEKTIEISKILVNDLEKDRDSTVNSKILTDNPSDILDDPDIDIVVVCAYPILVSRIHLLAKVQPVKTWSIIRNSFCLNVGFVIHNVAKREVSP